MRPPPSPWRRLENALASRQLCVPQTSRRKTPGQTGREEKRSPPSHSVRQLLVNLVAVGGDILRHYVHMGDDGIGRRQRDDHQNDCKQLTHGSSLLLSVYSDVISSFRQQSASWEDSARDCEKGSIGLGFEYEV